MQKKSCRPATGSRSHHVGLAVHRCDAARTSAQQVHGHHQCRHGETVSSTPIPALECNFTHFLRHVSVNGSHTSCEIQVLRLSVIPRFLGIKLLPMGSAKLVSSSSSPNACCNLAGHRPKKRTTETVPLRSVRQQQQHDTHATCIRTAPLYTLETDTLTHLTVR